MNAIRVLISMFILVLIAIAIAGWRWASAVHQPAWGRAALAGSVLAGIVGLVALWKGRSS